MTRSKFATENSGRFTFSRVGIMCECPKLPGMAYSVPMPIDMRSGPDHSILVRTQQGRTETPIQSVRLTPAHAIGCQVKTGAVREKKREESGMTQVPPVPVNARACTGCTQTGIHMRHTSAVFDAPELVTTGKGASMHTSGERG